MTCGMKLPLAVALLQYALNRMLQRGADRGASYKRTELLATCFVHMFFLGLFFDPEDGGNMLLTNIR